MLKAIRRLLWILRKSEPIKNWTPKNGYKGDDFFITAFKDNGVDFEAPNSKTGKITKGTVFYSSINQLYEMWDDIKSGNILRSQYTNCGSKSNTQTRYCLDILKELDNKGLI